MGLTGDTEPSLGVTDNCLVLARYCLDKNYGGWLSVWDRLFGTFQEERREEEIVYGLVDQPQFFDVIKHQLFYFDILQTKVIYEYYPLCISHFKFSGSYRGLVQGLVLWAWLVPWSSSPWEQ